MMFSHELIQRVLRLQKTQTRRLVKPGQGGVPPRCFYRPGSNHPLERPRLREEMTEDERLRVLHRRGRPPRHRVGRIEIVDVRSEPLGELTPADARAEGFDGTDAFVAYWVRLHDARWLNARPERADLVGDRFLKRWAHRPVWVITFKVVASTLLLAAEPGRTGDYVDAEFDERGERIAMADEREAVHPAIIDGWPKDPDSTHSKLKAAIAAGERRGIDQRALDRRLLSMEDRIRAARHAARLSSINVTPEIRAFQAAKKKKRSPETLEQRVRAVERRAYREEETADAA